MLDKSLPFPVDRAALLRALAESPDEVFSWFVAWCMTGYPDGLGGFRPESRASIYALRRAASEWGNLGPTKP